MDPYIHIFRPEFTLNGRQLQFESPQHSYTNSIVEKLELTDVAGETFLASAQTVSGLWPSDRVDYGDFVVDDAYLQGVQLKFLVEGYSGDASQLGFSLDWSTDPTHRLQRIGLPADRDGYYQDIELAAIEAKAADNTERPAVMEDAYSDNGGDDFDIRADVEALLGLQEQAKYLEVAISHKRQSLYKHVRQNREMVGLRDLVKQCDSVVCATKVIAQRICDRVHDIAEQRSGYFQLQNPQPGSQTTMSSHPHLNHQDILNCTKNKDLPAYADNITACKNGTATAQSSRDPQWWTDSSTSPELKGIYLVGNTSPLIRALEIIAGILGLATLFAVIKRNCLSLRTKVERAADREERRNARAYRRAARRAALRRRWGQFVNAINCFGHRERVEQSSGDYEEKRALILQEAFMDAAEDADLAEKGEIMEAEIRELRNVHTIVAGMVRCDPPPSRVPLPHARQPRNSRSSTTTLPSYSSETDSLPDYSSHNPHNPYRQHHSSTPSTPHTSTYDSDPETPANGFRNYTPTASDECGRYLPPPISLPGSLDSDSNCWPRDMVLARDGSGGAFPSIRDDGGRGSRVSSVLELSTRYSEETLGTRGSGPNEG